MIADIDTSALLRVVLREPGALVELRTYGGLVSSELIAVESARSIGPARAIRRRRRGSHGGGRQRLGDPARDFGARSGTRRLRSPGIGDTIPSHEHRATRPPAEYKRD